MNRVVASLLLVSGTFVSRPGLTQSSVIAAADTGEVTHSAHAQSAQRLRPTSVTLSLKGVLLHQAIDAIARQSGVRIAFSEDVLQIRERITLEASGISVEAAITKVLAGKALRYRITAPDGMIVEPVVRTRQATGTITGLILDSASAKPVPGAAVTVVGLKASAVSDHDGRFVLRNIAEGTHTVTVKLFGFRSAAQGVSVLPEKPASVQFRLIPTATELSGVVTTATGIQRKVEIGNDITTIRVDSVMRTMPVTSLTDLLATRVPGLTAAPTSGAPGAPSRIRIRGVSSINGSNDPIIIIDNMRMNARQIAPGGNIERANPDSLLEMLQVSSPIDQIDVNSIETVEVFKGPSAVALYGTDAANGVIVITTKRGIAGPAQWSMHGTWGQTTMPGKWPENYYMYGTSVGGFSSASGAHCPADQVGGNVWALRWGCFPDSLVRYQPLNDPRTTVFGTGITENYVADVRGGTRGIRYAMVVSTRRELGYLKMPDADVGILQAAGLPVPGWQRRPQSHTQNMGTSNVSIDLGSGGSVDVMVSLGRTATRSTPLQAAGNAIRRVKPANATTAGSGLLKEIPMFREQSTARDVRASSAMNAQLMPRNWLTVRAATGVDMTNQLRVKKIGRDECYKEAGGTCSRDNIAGNWRNDQGTVFVTTAQLSASARTRPHRWFDIQTTSGVNFNREQRDNLAKTSIGLPVGATSGNGAETEKSTEQRDDRTVAGIFVESRIGIADRFFLPLAIRKDAGSGLGANVMPNFPKLGLSYVVSDQPAFRMIPLIRRIETLRIRAAYGQSGTQPSVTAKLRTYTQTSAPVDGVTVAVVNRSGFGNTRLRPERSAEWEWGFDADLLQNRLNLTTSVIRKRTFDAIIGIEVPPSVDGGGSQQINVGTVVGTKLEVTLGATLVQHRAVSWRTDISWSSDANRLTRLNDQESSVVGHDGFYGFTSTRFVVGYPLYGQWARPIAGFHDVNGDGLIAGSFGNSSSEIQLADSTVYLGAPYPKSQGSLHSTMTLFQRLTLGATLNFQHELTQTTRDNKAELVYSQGVNDPSLPLATQAYFAASSRMCTSSFKNCSSIGFAQTVSALRFNAISLGYILPPALTQRLKIRRSVQLSVQGTNLGLWTNYRGKDPGVNAAMSEVLRDTGILPTARGWQLQMRIN